MTPPLSADAETPPSVGGQRPLSFTVAIDGPAAAGKGTIGRAVAAAVRVRVSRHRASLPRRGPRGCGGQLPEEAARALTPEDLKRDGLRTSEVGTAASKVAAVARGARGAARDFQKAFARRAGGAVLDGRDIGTVICPEGGGEAFS